MPRVVYNTYCVCLSSSFVLCMEVSNTYCVLFVFVLCMGVSNTYCVLFVFVLCLVYGGVQHIFCFVCLRLVYDNVQRILCCLLCFVCLPLLSNVPTLCCQFRWIVHSCLFCFSNVYFLLQVNDRTLSIVRRKASVILVLLT